MLSYLFLSSTTRFRKATEIVYLQYITFMQYLRGLRFGYFACSVLVVSNEGGWGVFYLF